jgi:hypothetical protein
MSKIKLNKIGNFQLTNNEKQELKGGEGVVSVWICSCRCCYEGTPGGSTSKNNASANAAIPTGSLPCPTVS